MELNCSEDQDQFELGHVRRLLLRRAGLPVGRGVGPASRGRRGHKAGASPVAALSEEQKGTVGDRDARRCLSRRTPRASATRPIAASGLLGRNLRMYGLGGLIAPFLGVKLIHLIVHNLLGA